MAKKLLGGAIVAVLLLYRRRRPTVWPLGGPITGLSASGGGPDVERKAVDEEKFVTLSRRGDVAAFNRLVVIYQQVVYNVAYRMLSDADAAADATQEAFLTAFQSIGQFRGGSFRAWLLRIATNTCYDQLRHRKRHPATSLEEMTRDPDRPMDIANHGEGPEEHALRREMHAQIQQGLSSLPDEQRIVVILSDVHGLSYEEIARATGSSVGTVKSRLSRGRAHMRDYLLRQGELLPARFRHLMERR